MAKPRKFVRPTLLTARKLTVAAATSDGPTVPPAPYTEQAKKLYEAALQRHLEEQQSSADGEPRGQRKK